jgi:hypothetical protein
MMKAPLREYAYMDPISVTWQQEAREHLRQALKNPDNYAQFAPG